MYVLLLTLIFAYDTTRYSNIVLFMVWTYEFIVVCKYVKLLVGIMDMIFTSYFSNGRRLDDFYYY